MATEPVQEKYYTPYQDTIDKLTVNKETAFKHRRRRHFDWTDNYMLYRDKVMLNRLTQRQSVNIPLIKSSIKTLLKDVDDPPILYFANLENNDEAENAFNEHWKYSGQYNHLVMKDIVDKRQVMLFGRSFKMQNIVGGRHSWEIVDPQDILIDRYVDPSDIDSARYVIREHMYMPLSSLMNDPKLDNNAVRRIQAYLGTNAGLVKAQENQLDWVEKQRREASLGVIDAFMPILGETYVELNLWWFKEFDKKSKEDDMKFLITAEDMDLLYSARNEDCIGQTQDHYWASHTPLSTWGDETERTDFWSDGVADTLRTLNKILNSWFSQMIENRTMRNFGMTYFNSSLAEEGFTPQTFEPVPWGWYPIPAGQNGKLADQIMPVEIPDLKDTMEQINFIMQIAQQASAATTFQQGVQPEGQQVTLGEVQLLLQNAQQRVQAMGVYYTECWKDFGLKFAKLMEAAGDMIDPLQIVKSGRLTKKKYAKMISPKDWYAKQGYKVEVLMKKDMENKTANDLQKLQYAKSLLPMNMALDKIQKRKSLEFADLEANEIEEVLKEDEQAHAQQPMLPQLGTGQQPPNGMNPAAPNVAQPQPNQPQPNSPMRLTA